MYIALFHSIVFFFFTLFSSRNDRNECEIAMAFNLFLKCKSTLFFHSLILGCSSQKLVSKSNIWSSEKYCVKFKNQHWIIEIINVNLLKSPRSSIYKCLVDFREGNILILEAQSSFLLRKKWDNFRSVLLI